mmetsp:Transcript_32177/g.102501  ORF Transcript_32177/g.102501 Transcript_32177/m.102501 type:complete len:277 (-) Transcript_32177:367-1197(-)
MGCRFTPWSDPKGMRVLQSRPQCSVVLMLGARTAARGFSLEWFVFPAMVVDRTLDRAAAALSAACTSYSPGPGVSRAPPAGRGRRSAGPRCLDSTLSFTRWRILLMSIRRPPPALWRASCLASSAALAAPRTSYVPGPGDVESGLSLSRSSVSSRRRVSLYSSPAPASSAIRCAGGGTSRGTNPEDPRRLVLALPLRGVLCAPQIPDPSYPPSPTSSPPSAEWYIGPSKPPETSMPGITCLLVRARNLVLWDPKPIFSLGVCLLRWKGIDLTVWSI